MAPCLRLVLEQHVVFGYWIDAFSLFKTRREGSHYSRVPLVVHLPSSLLAPGYLSSILQCCHNKYSGFGLGSPAFLCCLVFAHENQFIGAEKHFGPAFFSVSIVWWRSLVFQNIVGCSRCSFISCNLCQCLPTHSQEKLKLFCGCSEAENTRGNYLGSISLLASLTRTHIPFW